MSAADYSRGDFALRPCCKYELALAYTRGTMTRRNALCWLRTEIAKNPPLRRRLDELGYSPRQKMLTRAQVAAIFDAIGPP